MLVSLFFLLIWATVVLCIIATKGIMESSTLYDVILTDLEKSNEENGTEWTFPY